MKKIAIVVMLFIIGCTPSENLKRYSKRNIDRSYTVPEEVTLVQFSGFAYHEKRAGAKNQRMILPPVVPFIVRYGISDKLNLDLNVLFLPGISYEVFRNQKHMFGGSFGVRGFGYSEDNGFLFLPALEAHYRFLFSSFAAIETDASIGTMLRTKQSLYYSSLLKLKSGLLFQISSTFSLKPYFMLSNSKSDGDLSYENKFIVPIGAQFDFAAYEQLSFGVDYKYSSVNDSERKMHILWMHIRYLW